MMLLSRLNFFTPSVLAPGGTTLLGSTQKVALDRTWPIEEILINVFVTVNAACTWNTALASNFAVDNILSIVKNVNLSINDGVQPRTVVDMSGCGLLEYASLTGLNLDRSTLEIVRLSQIGDATIVKGLPASAQVRIGYRIPLVHPMIAEPLRTRCLLPVHTFPQDPVLTIQFGNSSDIIATGSFTTVAAEIVLIRRNMVPALDQQILQTGGYIPFDLVEQPFTIPTGSASEIRIPVSIPGSYLNLMARQYLGGATMSRDVVDNVTTFGSEQRWRLETGGAVIREWRWRQLQVINDWSRPYNGMNSLGYGTTGGKLFAGISSAGAVTSAFQPLANFGGNLATNAFFQPASSCILDFLSDGLDSVQEFGSVLDTNIPNKSGLKMEIIGTPANVATNSSVIFIGGHRLFGDLSPWQALKAA